MSHNISEGSVYMLKTIFNSIAFKVFLLFLILMGIIIISMNYITYDNTIKIIENEQKEIDRLVYDLYGLNDNDIKEVETWYARRYPKLAHLCDIDT